MPNVYVLTHLSGIKLFVRSTVARLIEKNTPDIYTNGLRKFIKHIGALKDGKKFWLKKSIEPYLY